MSTGTSAPSRDAAGNPTAIVGPFAQQTALAVGPDGLLSNIQDAVGDTFSYVYDTGGLLEATTTPRGGLYTYSYDSFGRLLQDVDPAGGGATLSLGSTTAGNVVTRTTAMGVASSYQIDNLPSTDIQQIVTGPDGLKDTVLRGHTGTNTQTSPDGTGNLLRVALPTGTNVDYVVDGENHRVGKKINGVLTEGFLYQDGLKIAAQLDGNGNLVARFVYANSRNVPDYYVTAAGTFRVLSDHLGSPRLVVDTANANIVEEIDYDEFGHVINDTRPGSTPFGFAGGLYDTGHGIGEARREGLRRKRWPMDEQGPDRI
jgi:YD repeat-containing protein